MNSPFLTGGSLVFDEFSIGNIYTYHVWCDTMGINTARWYLSQDMILRTLTVNTRLQGVAGDSCYLELSMTMPQHVVRKLMSHEDVFVDSRITYRKVDTLNMPIPANTQIDFDFEHSNSANTFMILTCEYVDFRNKIDGGGKSSCGIVSWLKGDCYE